MILSRIATLYDGASGEPSSVHRLMDVVIDRDGGGGGRIREVRRHAPGAAAPPGEVVDCDGLTATPGLIDCHAHVVTNGLGDEDLDRLNGPAGVLEVEKILHAMLVEGGVTTARDVGGATHLLKRLVEEGRILGPRLFIAIQMLSTTGGHADFRGRDRCHDAVSRLWPPAPGRPSAICDGPWECRKRVRELAACGADVIKICASPGVASPTDRLEHGDFSAEEIRAIVTEAEARGLRVIAHAHGEHGIRLAVDNGVHDIQHASFLTEDLAEEAVRRGCVITPTAWVIDELQRAESLPAFVREKARVVGASHAGSMKHAIAAGLPMLAGTDPVLPRMHGRNFMEIVHLVRVGLSPLAAWHGMTGLAASEIGAGDTGTIAPGRRADLLLWRGDVLADPTLMDRGALVEVIQGGRAHRGGLPGVAVRTFRDLTREA